MKLSIEVAEYNDAYDLNGDSHLISSRRLDKWAKSISDLEDQLAELRMRTLHPDANRIVSEYTENYKKLEEENAELRAENERIKRYSRCSMAPHANARPCIACGYPKD